MLNILGMIILIIILFIIILLLIGIRISFEYTKKGRDIKGCLKILIFRKIKIYSHDFPSPDSADDEDEDEEHERDIKKLFNLAKPWFEDFKVYLKSILNSMKITKLENHIIFGMSSYADTGKYIGLIWAALAGINPLHEKLKISAEPSFQGSVLDGYGTNHLEIYPFKLLIPTIRLVLKKDVRKFIRGVLDER